MNYKRTISICIPNWNRVDMLLESFEKVYNDERVSEIIISDDCSDMDIYEKLQSVFRYMPKVKMYRNTANADCYRNKKISVELATNKYVVLLDSDNIIDSSYLDNVFSLKWSPGRIIAPVFAMPLFDYREFENRVIDRRNVSQFMDKPFFETALNTCNFFVHRDVYIEAWDSSIDPVTSDSIYMAYKLLDKGCSIYFSPGLYYQHRVHEGSHYKINTNRTPEGFHESILNKLRQMS